MIKSLFRKYFSVIFILATLIGVFHHHNDLKSHSDCQICVVQASIANADTPTDVVYLSKLELFSEATHSQAPILHKFQIHLQLKARSPPKLS